MKIEGFLSLLLGAAVAGAASTTSALAENTAQNEELVEINRLAAALATAETTDDIATLVFDAQQQGLSNEEIAFAFGLAQRLTSNTILVGQAFAAFQAMVTGESTTTATAVGPLTAAFDSGAEAILNQPSDSTGSGSDQPFRGSPLGSAGFQGGSPGGGGSSPR